MSRHRWAFVVSLLLPYEALAQSQIVSQETLRRFAQEELSGPDVKSRKPTIEIKHGKLLHQFDFGQVTAAVEGPLLLQLRIELLRKHADVFGQTATSQGIAKLEAVVAELVALKQVSEKLPPAKVGGPADLAKKHQEIQARTAGLQKEFDALLIDMAVLAAADKKLAINPRYAFRPRPQYYCAGRLVDRNKVSFDDLRKAVEDYFTRDVLAFTQPSKTLTHDPINSLNIATFSYGYIPETPENPISDELFYLELMRRYPVITQNAARKHLPEIEKALRKQFEADPLGLQFLPGASPKPRPHYSFLIAAAFRDSAKEEGCVYSMNDPLRQEIIIGTGLEPQPALIRTDPKVAKVIVIPALTYRLATRAKTPISPVDTKTVANGQRPPLRVGVYVYQLQFADGQTSGFSSFRIPEDIDQQGVLHLR